MLLDRVSGRSPGGLVGSAALLHPRPFRLWLGRDSWSRASGSRGLATSAVPPRAYHAAG